MPRWSLGVEGPTGAAGTGAFAADPGRERRSLHSTCRADAPPGTVVRRLRLAWASNRGIGLGLGAGSPCGFSPRKMAWEGRSVDAEDGSLQGEARPGRGGRRRAGRTGRGQQEARGGGRRTSSRGRALGTGEPQAGSGPRRLPAPPCVPPREQEAPGHGGAARQVRGREGTAAQASPRGSGEGCGGRRRLPGGRGSAAGGVGIAFRGP